MARKEKQIKLAYITDHSIDEIVDAHIKLVTRDKEELYLEKVDDGDAEQKRFPTYKEVWKVVEENTNPTPRASTLKPKYVFLLHVIIERCRQNKGVCRLNYDFFVSLIGKHYGDMLTNLHQMQIIYVHSDYEIGKRPRSITLMDWNIGYIDNVTNLKVRGYLAELEKYLKEADKERNKAIVKTLGKDFTKAYLNNLSKLELVRRNEAIEYVYGREYKNEWQEHFYKSSIEDFNKDRLVITNVDDRGRIYHFLANCPRLLRRYFNLKYDVDIANSQPLLFSKFLIDEFNIDYSVIEYLSRLDYSLLDNDISGNKNIHNKGEILCKLLKKSDLEVQKLKVIPSDVLLYIFSCMKGMFWDAFVDTFKELDRGEVKENLFREVFYSHSRTMRHKEYGKVFAEIYPTVWHLIRELKKGAEQLCDRITKVESELFHNILGECFKREWCVVSIHDAIVVLDVPGNVGIDKGELIEIILSEYRKNGLIPTVHLEKF